MAPSRGHSQTGSRSLPAHALAALALASLVGAQQTTLSLPTVARFNITAGASLSFRIAPVAGTAGVKTVSYFVTLNICAPPSAASLQELANQPVLFASNSSSNSAPTRQAPNGAAAALAPNGFANITFHEPVSANVGMWVGVTAPDGSGVWDFEMGASSTAPLHILDTQPLLAFDDSDQTSAVLTGPMYAPTLDGTPSREILVAPNGSVPSQMSASSCFIRASAALVSQSNINTSTTQRGVFDLTAREGATGRVLQRTLAGLTRTQYAVTGLTASTNYSTWGLEGTGQLTAGQIQGVRLYQPQYFRTKTGNNCRLVYNMAACPQAAYAVPAPPTLPTADLQALYTQLMTPHLQNFNVTLSAFSCGDPRQGHYSYVRTCSDCMAAYTNWLCSVVMPRCDDVPPSQMALADQETAAAQAADTNSSVAALPPLAARPFPQVPFSSTAPQLILRADPTLSRTPIWGASAMANLTASNNTLAAFGLTTPFPYAEPPPCVSLCHQVYASCPPLISWTCPLVTITLEAAYGELKLLAPGTAQGGDQAGSSYGWGRPGDRYGDVFCNALGVDVLLALRSGGGAISGASALRAISLYLSLSAVLMSLMAERVTLL